MASVQAFGAVLRQHRLAAGHSQESLADLAGLSRRGISDIERGLKQTPHRDTVERLADALALEELQRAAFLAAARGQRPAPEARHTRRLPSTAIPLVGRQDELGLIDACLTGAAPPTLFLAGEPGMGKSRLLAEAARVARERGWEVIAGGCVRQSGQEPYEPLVSALAHHIGQMPPARQRVLLQGCAWLVRLLPELAERHVVPAPSWALPPPQERRLMFQAVARYAANVSGPMGTLLVLDDLQWASADALDLLASLVHTVGEQPLRVLGAYRYTEVDGSHALAAALADLARDGMATVAPLGPLEVDDALALLERLWTDGTEVSDVLRQRVLRRAGGVPFFLVSCARAMRVSGPSEAAPRDRASAEGGAETIPWDVAQTVRQRVAALPAPARELLAVAAVAGRVLPAAVLLAVTGNLGQSHWQTLDAVEACGQAGLLLEHDVARYRFAHDLIREVIEGDLSAARRTTLHREIATALRRLPGDPPVEQLAYHYARSDDKPAGLEYLRQAADHAAARYAHAEAESLYRAAHKLAHELGDRAREGAALEQLGSTLINVARYDEALDVLDEAERIFLRAPSDLEGRARVLAHIGHAHTGRGTVAAGIARVQTQMEPLAAAGISSRNLARLHITLGTLFNSTNSHPELLAAAKRAEDLARSISDDALVAFALWLRGAALSELGRLDEAQPLLEEAAAAAQASGDLFTLARAWLNLRSVHLVRGDFERARACAERGLEYAVQSGDPQLASIAYCLHAHAAYLAGDWDHARSLYERAAAAIRDVRLTSTANIPPMGLGRLRLAEGKEDASRLLAESMTLAKYSGNPDTPTTAAAALAERELLEGHPEAALERLAPFRDHSFDDRQYLDTKLLLPLFAWAHLEMGREAMAAEVVAQSLALAYAAGYRFALPDALRVQGLLALRQRRWQDARDALEQALEIARPMPYPYAEVKALYVYGQVHEAAGDPERARESYQQALAICARLGERLYAEHIERALHGIGASGSGAGLGSA